MKSIFKNKKASLWIIIAVIVILVVITIIKLNKDTTNEKQYQFPLTKEDIESVLSEQGINMYVEDISTIDETTSGPYLKNAIISIANLKNDDNITFGINSSLRNNHKFLNLIWYLPTTLPSDKFDNFFHNELSKQFELAGTFYGNKKGLDKELNKMLKYYLDDENYGNVLEWNEKVGNDHIKAQIKPMLNSNRNNIIYLLVIPDELYDDYLETLNNSKKLAAQENAKAFITDLYTVNAKEVDNYKSIINLTADVKLVPDAMEINDEMFERIKKNDEFLISLMTEEAYNTLVKNRENLRFTKLCYEGNYTMQVSEIQLSENINDIENKDVGYNYQIQLKYISQDGSESIGSVKGLIELGIIDGSWKVTGYNITHFDQPNT